MKMKIVQLVSITCFTLLSLSACSGDLMDPDPLRLHLSTSNTLTGDPQGVVNEVFKSTNELNYGKSPTKWAHVLWVEANVVVPEQVTLRFVSNRAFLSCFEYRIDDEAPTSTVNSGNNYNPSITDGMWIFTCRNNNSTEITIQAKSHVDVRMSFGAERNERFDWTRFYVLSLNNKDQCKGGDWQAFGFKNQGQCVRFVETGKDSRIGQ